MRLVTRSDFDGIVCAVLLKELEIADEIFLSHPKDLQDGKIPITSNDVLANVPYVEGCGLWFDHHSSEEERLNLEGKFEGASRAAPSTARVIYEYYNGAERLSKFDKLMKYVDLADAGQFTEDDILNPKRWVLLAFLCDPRTGLGYHRSYRISNKQLMSVLVDHIRTMDIDQILELPDVKERVDRYFDMNEVHKNFLHKHSYTDGPVVVTDSRGVTDIPPGNRFLIYPLYPDTNISIRIIDGKNKEFAAVSVGYSITNRTSNVDVGSLLLKYGGGGHKQVGTCQVPYADADRVVKEVIEAIKAQS
ncbi:exopolyphosphatase [candidate division CSSED10-310 bacterium]|uniref:Exopolyphosphatase n=1 Tax=candidate division CSSED10-310 bacterium TaxID=2855610 RepID=A0ABV6YZ62_UNCC1